MLYKSVSPNSIRGVLAISILGGEFMNQYAMKSMKQLELFEGGVEMKKQPAKRVNIAYSLSTI